MRKLISSLIIMVIVLISTSKVNAASYTLVVDDSSLTKNQNIVFEEANIGPGFNKDYEIIVQNISSKVMRTRLVDIQVLSSSILLDQTQLAFIKNNITISEGTYDSVEFKNCELLCNDLGKTENIKVNMNIPTNLTNIYQGLSFKLQFNFEVYESHLDCEENQIKNPDVLLPQTGESTLIYTILYTIIIVSFISMVLFIILIKKEKKHEKNIS